jgi:4-hydroxy-tetrahydrodipicolinate synthase
MKRLHGAMSALITPFTAEGAFDEAGARRVLRQQIDGGIDGLVVGGTTGESPTIEDHEKQRYTELARELAPPSMPIIVGTGSNSTKETVRMTAEAKRWGADFALVVCPYYNKPTQEGLYQHFKAVHDAVGLPIVAYNVPGRTVSDLMPETIARLVADRLIVAVKEATANMWRLSETLALVDAGAPFTMLSGDDFTILPFVAAGGEGVISVVSNVAPGDTSRLVSATREGRFAEARALQAKLGILSKALFATSSPIPVKAAMAQLGLCESALRLPLVMDAKTEASMRDALRVYGLLA